MNVMCQLSDTSLSSFYTGLLSAAGATSVTTVLSTNITSINVANFDAFFFSSVDSANVANKIVEAFNAGKKIAFGTYSGSTTMLNSLNLGSFVDKSGIAVNILANSELQSPFDVAQSSFSIRPVSGYISGYSAMPAGVISLNSQDGITTSFIALNRDGFLADTLFIGWLPWSSSAPTLTTDGENYVKAMLARWMQMPPANKLISGYVRDTSNNPLVRTVRLYRRDTGEMLLETSTNERGLYNFTTTYSLETYVVCLGGTDQNSQIKDKIIAN
jgi:hypothetical protein